MTWLSLWSKSIKGTEYATEPERQNEREPPSHVWYVCGYHSDADRYLMEGDVCR
jgi:hypothetical protein